MVCEVFGALLVLRGYVTVARVVFCEGIQFYCGADSRPVCLLVFFDYGRAIAISVRCLSGVCEF